jgi:hypothetical protein
MSNKPSWSSGSHLDNIRVVEVPGRATLLGYEAIFDLTAEVVRHPAVGERDIRSALDQHDVGLFRQPSGSSRDRGPPAIPPTMTIFILILEFCSVSHGPQTTALRSTGTEPPPEFPSPDSSFGWISQ